MHAFTSYVVVINFVLQSKPIMTTYFKKINIMHETLVSQTNSYQFGGCLYLWLPVSPTPQMRE